MPQPVLLGPRSSGGEAAALVLLFLLMAEG